MRRVLLIGWSAAVFVALIPRCGGFPCTEGAPCSADQAGVACSQSACESLVCDGKQVDRLVKSSGDSCNQPGATCPDPLSSGPTGPCGGGSLVCSGAVFYYQPAVWPASPCSQQGLTCHFPDTECQSCTCNGAGWVCQMSANCTPMDAGSGD